MAELTPMIGLKYGSLTVTKRMGSNKYGRAMWLCKCDCGNESIVEGAKLRSGHTRTCGHCEKYTAVDSETMKCTLLNGKSFLISPEDYKTVSKHKWSVDKYGYVITSIGQNPVTSLKLHRYLLDAPKGFFVDHINGDPSDNRRSNLRICNVAESSYNTKKHSTNRSGYKGVSVYPKRNKKYLATIRAGGKHFCLGYYFTAEDAAKAYDEAALRLHGEFARLNFA